MRIGTKSTRITPPKRTIIFAHVSHSQLAHCETNWIFTFCPTFFSRHIFGTQKPICQPLIGHFHFITFSILNLISARFQMQTFYDANWCHSGPCYFLSDRGDDKLTARWNAIDAVIALNCRYSNLRNKCSSSGKIFFYRHGFTWAEFRISLALIFMCGDIDEALRNYWFLSSSIQTITNRFSIVSPHAWKCKNRIHFLVQICFDMQSVDKLRKEEAKTNFIWTIISASWMRWRKLARRLH